MNSIITICTVINSTNAVRIDLWKKVALYVWWTFVGTFKVLTKHSFSVGLDGQSLWMGERNVRESEVWHVLAAMWPGHSSMKAGELL